MAAILSRPQCVKWRQSIDIYWWHVISSTPVRPMAEEIQPVVDGRWDRLKNAPELLNLWALTLSTQNETHIF